MGDRGGSMEKADGERRRKGRSRGTERGKEEETSLPFHLHIMLYFVCDSVSVT